MMDLMWFLRLFVSPAITLITFIWAASFSSPAAAQVLAKLRLFGVGLLTMLLSTDKRFKAPETDPDVIQGASDAVTKRVVFIRHGESDWNEVFNRGFGPSFFVRLLRALYREAGELSITPDSVFIDSALSPLGMVQARELVQFLEVDSATTDHPHLHALLKGDSHSADSVIISSNLRRALATAAIGLQQRLQRTGEKVHIASCLQEISFNLDAGALAPAQGIPDLHAIAPEMWPAYDPQRLFDASANYGDKPIFGTGLQRMLAFCELVFSREERTVVATGHSLYFRSFFQTFLPRGAEHVAKKKKMVNAGTVAFDISRAKHAGETVYRIDPASVTVLYGGFAR